MTTASPESRIRSYKLRRGRVTVSQSDALRRLWPRYGVGTLPLPPGPNAGAPPPADLGLLAEPAALFGRTAALVVEVGFGMGEATAALAARQPDLDVLAVDLHTPGVGSLLRRLDELHPEPPVRVVMADAVDVLQALPPRSVTLVRAFFPDPWPKSRHAKRRLVSPGFLDLLATRLVPPAAPPRSPQSLAPPAAPPRSAPLPGLHVATDWPGYAEHVRAVVAAHPRFTLAEPVPDREPTRFERLAAAAGRAAVDLYATLLPG